MSRPRKTTDKQIKLGIKLRTAGKLTVGQICTKTGMRRELYYYYCVPEASASYKKATAEYYKRNHEARKAQMREYWHRTHPKKI